MKRKIRFFFKVLISVVWLAPVIFVACNNPNPTQQKTTTQQPTTTATAPQPSVNNAPDPNEPNPYVLRKRLFDYLERHQKDTVFDTTDDTWSAYEGPDVYSPNRVTAGHVLNNKQFHCIVQYADANNGLFIYIKKGGGWKQIFGDTDFVGRRYPELKDWNNDGIPDISLNMTGQTSSWESYAVWLVDKGGEKIYPVDEFDMIPNPVLDPKTGRIKYTSCNNYGWIKGEMAWQHFKLIPFKSVDVLDNMPAKVKDSNCIVTIKRYHQPTKKIYCDLNDAYKLVPKDMQDTTDQFCW